MLVGIHPPAITRRELYARIASAGHGRDVCRAERLLLRALERDWPTARIERLLSLLLHRVGGNAAARGNVP